MNPNKIKTISIGCIICIFNKKTSTELVTARIFVKSRKGDEKAHGRCNVKAGAVATGESTRKAESLGLSAADYLSRNDAYHFFEMLGDLIKTGPTGTNVNDLIFLFAF